MVSQAEIDEIDVKILKTLLKDARTSFADIARDCLVSTNAIVKRFYRLKRIGVIVGTTLCVKREIMGYRHCLTLGVIADSAHEQKIIEWLRNQPNVVICFKSVGKFDIIATAFAESFETLERQKEDLKKQPGVRQVTVSIWTDRIPFINEDIAIAPTRV